MIYDTYFLPIMDKEGAFESLPIIEQDLLADGFVPLTLITDKNNEVMKQLQEQYTEYPLYGVIIYLDYIDLVVT